MNDIEAAFHQYFEIIKADTPELLKTVFDLRYRILCVQSNIPGFDASNYPDKLENDQYDSHSINFLLRHRPTNAFIGTTRLILQNPHNPEDKFPTELNARFYPGFVLDSSSRKHTTEVSRFAILSDFFKRNGERSMVSQSTKVGSKVQERRRFPHPMLGLVVGLIQLCAEYNIYHLISAMEPNLNRLLGFYGLQMNPVGPPADYHGSRIPYYLYVPDLLDRMYQDHHSLWELITDHGRIWPVNLSNIYKEELRSTHINNIYISGNCRY